MSKYLDSKKLVHSLFISLIVIRILILILFYSYLAGFEISRRIVVDPYHHYQFALIILFFTAVFFRKVKRYFSILLGVATGFIIDEHTILFSDFGINLPYKYLSWIDHLIIIIIILGILFSLVKNSRKKLIGSR